MQQRNQHCTLYFYTIAIDAEYVSSHCGSTGGSKQCVQLATSSEKGTIDFNSIQSEIFLKWILKFFGFSKS